LPALAASLALVALGAWWAARAWPPGPADDRLGRELVAAHVRSLLAEHLLDVRSSDRHTVKPWFLGKLNFAPPVPDLAGHDFPLAGGRLDYLDDRPVAACVYKRRQHVINLFVWPSDSAPNRGAGTATRQGYHLAHWCQGGMTYWAVSDLNEAELQEFARLIQEGG
jgi:anti-sigma factor RsiW